MSKTLLNRLDWEKVKHLCTFVKTSKHFRPFGTCPSEEAKVTLRAEKGATIESYVYVIDDKREQSLPGEQDAICLGIVKLHPQGAAEAVSPDNPESEAQDPEEFHILKEVRPHNVALCQVEKTKQK